MSCTTILVGKKASFDGSTIMARNEDSSAGKFSPKKFIVVRPEDQPRHYKSVLSGVEIDLPEKPMRYTAMPNALPDQGIWGECGVNEANVAMTETETITSNPRVQAADPLVKGGIGEEDFLTLVLPYIRSAREGVLRLGALLEKFGTYEMNGVGFQDRDEIWWMETIGGHHWIAKRVPDDRYVVMPNQQGIDSFDLVDAFSDRRDHLCSEDLVDFIRDHSLDLTVRSSGEDLSSDNSFDVRAAFGSHDDSDHSYNTPRAWDMLRHLNPRTFVRDENGTDYTPADDDLPWSMAPEHLVTIEDVKYVLSSHFQGTPFDPYGRYGDGSQRGQFRPIGVNRTNFLGVTQLRPGVPEEICAVEWVAMGSNVFNALVPFYANVDTTPEYLSNTGREVSTESFYWANRLIGALADAQYSECAFHIERYQNAVVCRAGAMLKAFDAYLAESNTPSYLAECNQKISDMVREETQDVLDKVLYEASCGMANRFSRSDA